MTAPRVLLLVPARTYRAADFLTAASRLGLDLVVGSDGALPLGGRPVVPVSPRDPERSAAQIIATARPPAPRPRSGAGGRPPRSPSRPSG